jgi:hypothetical protein
MYYTKCKLEQCENKFALGGTGIFCIEWIPTHLAKLGDTLKLGESFWTITEVGKSATITKYMEKLGYYVLEQFRNKPWYEALDAKRSN